jgi:hypothetical protein
MKLIIGALLAFVSALFRSLLALQAADSRYLKDLRRVPIIQDLIGWVSGALSAGKAALSSATY